LSPQWLHEIFDSFSRMRLGIYERGPAVRSKHEREAEALILRYPPPACFRFCFLQKK
jgi:hypothetical protein